MPLFDATGWLIGVITEWLCFKQAMRFLRSFHFLSTWSWFFFQSVLSTTTSLHYPSMLLFGLLQIWSFKISWILLCTALFFINVFKFGTLFWCFCNRSAMQNHISVLQSYLLLFIMFVNCNILYLTICKNLGLNTTFIPVIQSYNNLKHL